MYLLELAPVSVQGAMGVFTSVGVNFGVFFGQFMGLDWILGECSVFAEYLFFIRMGNSKIDKFSFSRKRINNITEFGLFLRFKTRNQLP